MIFVLHFLCTAFFLLLFVPYFSWRHLGFLGDCSYLKNKIKAKFLCFDLRRLTVLKPIQKSLCICVLLSLSHSHAFRFPELSLYSPLLNPRLGWIGVARTPGLKETGSLPALSHLSTSDSSPAFPVWLPLLFRLHKMSEWNRIWETIWSTLCFLLMPREGIPVSKYFRIINCLTVGNAKSLKGSLSPSAFPAPTCLDA